MVDEVSYKVIRRLTQRDLDVGELMVQGKTNSQIADALGLTVGTIKNYTANLIRKLDAANRVEAAVMLTESGVFFPNKVAMTLIK